MTLSGFHFKKTKKLYETKFLTSLKYLIISLHVSCLQSKGLKWL